MGEPTPHPRRGRAGSARFRILGWIVVLLASAGPATLLLQRQVLRDRLDDEVSESLTQEVEELRVLAAGRDPLTGEPFAGDVRAIFDTFLRRNLPPEGEALVTFVAGDTYATTPAPAPLDADPGLATTWAELTEPTEGVIGTDAGTVRFLAVPVDGDHRGDGVFVVANFLAGERQEIDQATTTGAAIYASVLLVAIGIGWYAAGRVLEPVRVMTDTARRLTDSNMTSRIPVPSSQDEIADLARTFNDMLDRLQAAFRSQRQFLDDASHELRTPLTIIRGHVELDGDDAAERAEAKAIVLDELDRMARIVNDLLVLARAEEPNFLQREPIDLPSLLTDVVSKARVLADRDWRVAIDCNHRAFADRQRLAQALVNLVDNAARHTQPGGRIEVACRSAPGTVSISITDDGPGIPLEDQNRIFERFTRASGARPDSGSAGLGLAIVKAIAEAHGGTATVNSRPGAGATFAISIPIEA